MRETVKNDGVITGKVVQTINSGANAYTIDDLYNGEARLLPPAFTLAPEPSRSGAMTVTTSR